MMPERLRAMPSCRKLTKWVRTYEQMKRYFRHYKGNLYEYLGEGQHSETLEEMVIYQAQYGDHKIWIRPKKMFFENVTLADGRIVKRFEEVNND